MGYYNFRRLSLILTTWFLAGQTYADDKFEDFLGLSLKELIEVEIYTASQETEKAAESPATISVITAQNLKDWGIVSLHDALSLLPGINKNETYLGQTTQTFRGVTPGLFNNKSLYLINGHPSYESLFGSTLLDYIPIELVERIEVVRSPASVLYGTNAISGVINIITKQGPDNKNTATIRGGSNSHKYGSLVYHSENLTMASSAQRDAGYEYSGTNDEFGNPVNMDYRYDVENLFIDGYGENWRVNAAIFDREKALYGVNSWVWQSGTFETYVGYLDANKKFKISTGEMNIWLRYDISDKDLHISNFPYPADLAECRSLNIPTTPFDPCVLANPQNRTDTSSNVINKVERYSLEVQFKDHINEQLGYIIGASFETQKSDPLLINYSSDASLNQPAFADKHETDTSAAYAQAKYKASDDIVFSIGIRGESGSESGSSGLMPRLGASYQVIPDTYIKIQYSEAFRTPTFIEKYVSLPNVLIGDETLKRETIKTFEIGLDSQLSDHNHLQLSVYTLDLEDEILRFPSTTGPATEYRNGEGKEMQGVEVEWNSLLAHKLKLTLNASYVDGKDKSLGENDAPIIANELANAILTYYINSHWNITLTAQYIGEKDVVSSTTNQRSTIDSYQLFNIASVYNIKQHEFRLIVTNLSDEEYSYPEPVRRITMDVPGGTDLAAYAQYQYRF